MTPTEYIIEKHSETKQLSHASNIITKLKKGNLTPKQKVALNDIVVEYAKYLKEIVQIKINSDKDIEKSVKLLNKYYNFLHKNKYDNTFSAQGKFRPTILEEFLYFLFRDIVHAKKIQYDSANVVSSGNVKAYTNLFFKAKDFPNFIKSPEIGINEKDQDYAIFRSFDVAIDNNPPIKVQIPAIAIEAKTYIDKTMLDSIIATAEKLKSGNPYTRFVVVAERYDVGLAVDPSYSRIDQIYVLRKGMRKDEWKEIDSKVVCRLFHETTNHMERPWSDISQRLNEEGVIL